MEVLSKRAGWKTEPPIDALRACGGHVSGDGYLRWIQDGSAPMLAINERSRSPTKRHASCFSLA